MSLGKEFSKALSDLHKAFEFWKSGGVQTLEKNMRVIGQLVKGQAQRRVPVDSNRLKQGILAVTYQVGNNIITDVGTNVKSDSGFPYPVVIEFGSKHIAGGAVQALGEGLDITDAEAITDWPAKTARGASKQQMPFLRPAWNAVKPTAIKLIDESFEPPSQRGR